MKNLNLKTAITAASILLALSAEIAAQVGGNWPQWRGPNRDGISTETGAKAVAYRRPAARVESCRRGHWLLTLAVAMAESIP